MKRKLMALLAVLLVAGVARSEDLKGVAAMPKVSAPAYSVDLGPGHTDGVYTLKEAYTRSIINLDRGASLTGNLYHCMVKDADADKDGSVDASAGCGTTLGSLGSDINDLEVGTGKRWLVIDIDNAESGTSRLTVRGTNDQATATGSGSGDPTPQDDFAVVNCSSGVATIPSATGVYKIPSTSTCTADDTILIPDIGSLNVAAAKQPVVINDSGFRLLVDPTTAGNTVINESGSLHSLPGTTFVIQQSDPSELHLIGLGTGGANSVDQIIPVEAQQHVLLVNATDPNTFELGTGISMKGSGAEALDHVIGWFYNKPGPDGLTTNQFEHAWHHRAEANFVTANLTQVEFNQDVAPPDNESNVIGQSAGFGAAAVVDAVITFGSGATAKVLAWNDPLLEFRMTGVGGSPLAEDSIDIGGNTATLGATVTYLGETPGHFWRPVIQNWFVESNRANFSWRTSPDAANAVLRLGIGGAVFNAPGNVAPGVFRIEDRLNVTYNSSGDDGGSASTTPRTLEVTQDFTGTNFLFNQPAGIIVRTPVTPLGSGTTMDQPSALWIEDQLGLDDVGGGDHAVLRIAAQTCGGSGCLAGNTGNFAMLGGEHDNGHIVLGSLGSTGAHIYADFTDGTVRWRSIDPSGGNDTLRRLSGNSFVSGTRNTEFGILYGITSDAAAGTSLYDTGAKICSFQGDNSTVPGVGLTCNRVWDMTAGTEPASCTTVIPDGNFFQASCR